jgi:hypothetical protein
MSDKEQSPMDPGAQELLPGEQTVITHASRLCYALRTLVEEFTELFPETTYEVFDINGRNTALSVRFNLAAITDQEREDAAAALIRMLAGEPRVLESGVEAREGYVRFRPSARTQDNPETFSLRAAYEILIDWIE